MIHSDSCVDLQARFAVRSAEWASLYPEACRTCDAHGWIEGYDSVPMPFGPGNCSMPSGEPCECTYGPLGRGRCARCRAVQMAKADSFIDDRLACYQCGWKWGDQPLDYRPEFECWGDCIREAAI